MATPLLTPTERRRRRFLIIQTKRRLLGVGPLDAVPLNHSIASDDKKVWRKLKNRQSAAASRKRRLDTIESLSIQLSVMSKEVDRLRRKLSVYECVPEVQENEEEDDKYTVLDDDDSYCSPMNKRRRTHCFIHEPAVF